MAGQSRLVQPASSCMLEAALSSNAQFAWLFRRAERSNPAKMTVPRPIP
jgi:hypothetical protein